MYIAKISEVMMLILEMSISKYNFFDVKNSNCEMENW